MNRSNKQLKSKFHALTRNFQKTLIKDALSMYGNNESKVSRLLGISRSTVRSLRKIQVEETLL